MNPSRRVRMSALVLCVLGVVMAAGSVSAQLLYSDARRLLGLSPDPIARTPRLLGMGSLTLVIDDPQNRIAMWDFAGNPTGVLDADTASTVDLRPAAWSTTQLHDQPGFTTSTERQHFSASELRIGAEVWHRTPGSNVYGAIGDLGTLELDRPWSSSLERRNNFSRPRLMPILNGHMPFVLTERLLYALRFQTGQESNTYKLKTITSNAAGQYIDLNGTTVAPPEFFTPDEVTVKTRGVGAALSYRFGAFATLAAGLDQTTNHIEGQNNDPRHESQTEEDRPYGTGQLSLIGHTTALKRSTVEWGADARGWKSSSDARWVYTMSSGTAAYISGRGTLLDRKENGSTVRTRVRWLFGGFEAGAGFNTAYRRIEITAPDLGDSNSFNHFRNVIFNNSDTDSLTLPDSVFSNQSEQRAWEFGGGVSWRTAGRRTIVGVEYHRQHDLFQQDVSGRGPKQEWWDVRGGVEWLASPGMSLRGGYIYHWHDRDGFTQQNELLGHTLTLGFGLAPQRSHWSVEIGYNVDWSRADYGDPGTPSGSSQQLAMRVHWAF